MATPTDPTFGASFTDSVADMVRSRLKSAMQMGAPNSVSDRVTFLWPKNFTYDASIPVDESGTPYDFNAVPTNVNEHPEVQVDVAVEATERNPTGTALGQMDNPRIELTLLDVDYEQVVGATQVRYGGNIYQIDYWKPEALFPIDVWTAYCHAEDET